MHSGITNTKAKQVFEKFPVVSPDDNKRMEYRNTVSSVWAASAAWAKEMHLAELLEHTRFTKAQARVSTSCY